MRIAIDVMGGDHAPQEIVLGALRASRELDAELVLVGRGAEILQVLEQQGIIVATPEGATVSDRYDGFMEEMAEYIEELATRIERLRGIL